MNLLSTSNISEEMLDYVIKNAYFFSRQDELQSKRKGKIDKVMVDKIMGTFFLEPSTRTRWSFETAFKKLGGSVISTEAGSTSTSQAKGESFTDTISTLSQYVDFLTIRSPQSVKDWGELNYDCCVINAGSGSEDHPTQALTDAVTIYQKFGRLHDLKIGIVGDLRRSRSIASFVNLLSSHDYSNKFYTWGVEGEKLSNDLYVDVEYQDDHDYRGIEGLDVLYLNRIQKERWPETYNAPVQNFSLSKDKLDLLSDNSIVMNPGPRQEEMPYEFDKDPRVVYLTQVKNGLYVRMALIKYLGEKNESFAA